MSWVRIAKEADVKPGHAKVVFAGPKRIALCNTGHGYHAIDDVCSHDGGPLGEGKLLDDHRIECPRHGAQFDITTGRALTLPAIRPITAYKTRVTNGHVEIELRS